MATDNGAHEKKVREMKNENMSALGDILVRDKMTGLYRRPTVDEVNVIVDSIASRCIVVPGPALTAGNGFYEPQVLSEMMPEDERSDHAFPMVNDKEVACLTSQLAEEMGEDESYVFDIVCAKAFSGVTLDGLKAWLVKRIKDEEARKCAHA